MAQAHAAPGSSLVTGDWIISSVTTAHAGWTNVSATYSDRFMRINATPLTTGGADTHTHAAGTYSGSAHTHSCDPNDMTEAGGGGATVYGAPSAFTSASGGGEAITGSSAAANNIPAFVQVVIFQKD